MPLDRDPLFSGNDPTQQQGTLINAVSVYFDFVAKKKSTEIVKEYNLVDTIENAFF